MYFLWSLSKQPQPVLFDKIPDQIFDVFGQAIQPENDHPGLPKPHLCGVEPVKANVTGTTQRAGEPIRSPARCMLLLDLFLQSLNGCFQQGIGLTQHAVQRHRDGDVRDDPFPFDDDRSIRRYRSAGGELHRKIIRQLILSQPDFTKSAGGRVISYHSRALVLMQRIGKALAGADAIRADQHRDRTLVDRVGRV